MAPDEWTAHARPRIEAHDRALDDVKAAGLSGEAADTLLKIRYEIHYAELREKQTID